MRQVKVDFGGEYKEFPLGVSILLYGHVASGKTTFSLTLVSEFIKNGLPCVWVSLDESPQAVREKMDYFQIDWNSAQERNLMRFIDVYSEQITGKRMQDPYVIGCSSAFNLNEINRALMKALSEVTGQGIVVFDSVSTLLLYNRAGTCEEFLKVHMSRITSAGHSGFFILQRDLHEQQIEETLKMMCDSVLEFGFDKGSRKISILKLPLGSSGEWIESSLFAWQQPKGVTVSRPSGPRKYMDSGGYIEEFRDGLIEGLKEGLSNVKIESKAASGPGGGGGSTGSGSSQSDGSGGVGGSGGLSESQFTGGGSGTQAQGGVATQPVQIQVQGVLSGSGTQGQGGVPQTESINQPSTVGSQVLQGGYSQGPTTQHIDKQIIVTQLPGLPEQLGEELKKLLREQLKLRDALHEKEEASRESKKKLDQLANKEQEAASEAMEVDERTQALRKAIDTKNAFISKIETERHQAEAKYQGSLKRLQVAKAKAESILNRKRNLESKIHDLVADSGELYIDLGPYLTDVLAKVETEATHSKAILDDLGTKIAVANNEIRHMSEEMQQIAKHGQYVKEELEEVKTKKAKIESEISLIFAARAETEARMQQIQNAKRQLEQKLNEIMGGTK